MQNCSTGGGFGAADVYERLTKGKAGNFWHLMATQVVSGVWHGLFPGYAMFFFNSAFMFETGKVIFRYERMWPQWVKSFPPWLLLKWFYTSFTLNYSAAPFAVRSPPSPLSMSLPRASFLCCSTFAVVVSVLFVLWWLLYCCAVVVCCGGCAVLFVFFLRRVVLVVAILSGCCGGAAVLPCLVVVAAALCRELGILATSWAILLWQWLVRCAWPCLAINPFLPSCTRGGFKQKGGGGKNVKKKEKGSSARNR
jgi:MBOAT, membrane-bound O-acyltransferase family